MPGVFGRGRAVLALAGALIMATAGGALAKEPPGPRLLTTQLTGLSALASRIAHPPRAPVVTLGTISLSGGPPNHLLRGELRKGSFTPNFLTRASWSGDGSTVAFAGGEAERGRIYYLDVAGGGPHPVPGTRHGFGPVLSPDGQTIAFLRTRERYGVDRELAELLPKGLPVPKTKLLYSSTSTWLVGLDGSHLRQLTPWRNGLDEEPTSFSPDGTRLALTQHAKGHAGPSVVLADLAGGNLTAVVPTAEQAAISPDGTRIAYLGYADLDVVEAEENKRYPAPDLYVSDLDGRHVRRLTHSRGVLESAPSWDPSGSRIAYVSARASTKFVPELDNLFPAGNSIMQMNADGSCRKRVASRPAIAFYGAEWEPGPGREAGPLSC
jgi:Tol biopolymer transport system component